MATAPVDDGKHRPAEVGGWPAARCSRPAWLLVVAAIVVIWLLGLALSWRLSARVASMPDLFADIDRFAAVAPMLRGVGCADLLIEPLPERPERFFFAAQYELLPTILTLHRSPDAMLAAARAELAATGSYTLLLEQTGRDHSAVAEQLAGLAAELGQRLHIQRAATTTGQLLLLRLGPLATPGQTPEPRRPRSPASPAAAWLLLVALLSAGLLLAVAASGRGGGIDLVAAVAWAPAVSLGLLSVVFFLHLLLGLGRPAGWWLLLLAGALWLLLRWCCGAATVAPLTAARTGRQGLLGGLLLLVTVAGLGMALQQWRQARPNGSWDAIAIWNANARLLSRTDQGFGDLLRAQREGHPDYPLLLPAAIAAQWSLLGGELAAVPRATGVAVLLGLAAMIWTGFARAGAARLTPAMTALVLVTPMLWRWAFCQVADLLLCYLLLAAAIGLASLVGQGQVRPVPPLLTGLALGLLPWAKMEGGLLAVTLLVLAIVAAVRCGQRLPWQQLLQLVAGALPGVLVTVLHSIAWAPDQELQRYLHPGLLGQLVDGERWLLILRALFGHLSPVHGFASWGLLWLLLTVLTLLYRRRLLARGAILQRFLLAVFVAGLLIDVGVYLVSPYELAWHLGSSLDRLLLQLSPLPAVALLSLAAQKIVAPEQA